MLIQTKQAEEKEELYVLVEIFIDTYVCKCRIFILWWLLLTESGYSCSTG